MTKNPILQRLGEAILLRRRRLNLSQEALGEKAGLHRTHVGAVERGEANLTVLNMVNLAGALGTTAHELFREAGL